MRLMPMLLACVLISSCAINQETLKKSVLIDPGMNKTQVIELMGPPADRQFRGKGEAWQYCQTSVMWTTDKFKIVWFNNGFVVGVTTYNRSDYIGMCENHFSTINWEEAPDATVEMRYR